MTSNRIPLLGTLADLERGQQRVVSNGELLESPTINFDSKKITKHRLLLLPPFTGDSDTVKVVHVRYRSSSEACPRLCFESSTHTRCACWKSIYSIVSQSLVALQYLQYAAPSPAADSSLPVLANVVCGIQTSHARRCQTTNRQGQASHGQVTGLCRSQVRGSRW